MLTVGLAADAAETVTFHNALESLALRNSRDVDPVVVLENIDGNHVAQIQFLFEAGEFDQLTLGSGVGLLEMAHQRIAGILFRNLVIGKLHGRVAVLLGSLHLRNNTGTSFNHSAWYILTLGTENGSHSDFFSN